MSIIKLTVDTGVNRFYDTKLDANHLKMQTMLRMHRMNKNVLDGVRKMTVLVPNLTV